MDLLRIIVIGLIFSLFQGCASVPSSAEMQSSIADFKLPKYPKENEALVYVVRPSSLGTLVRFNVFLDNQEATSEVGYNRGGQYIYFPVVPGERKILSKAENWAEWVINVKAGEIIFLQQEPAMGVVIARNTLDKIDDVKGKYYVKTLVPGTILKPER